MITSSITPLLMMTTRSSRDRAQKSRSCADAPGRCLPSCSGRDLDARVVSNPHGTLDEHSSAFRSIAGQRASLGALLPRCYRTGAELDGEGARSSQSELSGPALGHEYRALRHEVLAPQNPAPHDGDRRSSDHDINSEAPAGSQANCQGATVKVCSLWPAVEEAGRPEVRSVLRDAATGRLAAQERLRRPGRSIGRLRAPGSHYASLRAPGPTSPDLLGFLSGPRSTRLEGSTPLGPDSSPVLSGRWLPLRVACVRGFSSVSGRSPSTPGLGPANYSSQGREVSAPRRGVVRGHVPLGAAPDQTSRALPIRSMNAA